MTTPDPAAPVRTRNPPRAHDWREYMDGKIYCAACGERVLRSQKPTPDARIAELERLVAGFEAGGRVSFGDCSPEVQNRLGRIAEIETTLREIERLTARTERDSRGDDRTIKFIADTARRALGDAHG